MATTRLIPLHAGEGRSIGTAISDSRFADAEFLFSKKMYEQKTGRRRGKDNVIAYHMRQSFVPGEITPEEANRLGRELAMRFTKGKNAFIVCTHIDKAHVHNHIIFNSINLDQSRKFRNFRISWKALSRLNDTICIENGFCLMKSSLRNSAWRRSQFWKSKSFSTPKREMFTSLIEKPDTPKSSLRSMKARSRCTRLRRNSLMNKSWKSFRQ